MNVHFAAFRDRLLELGFVLDQEQAPGTIVEGVVSGSQGPVARYRFNQPRPDERLSLTIMPLDPDRATVMAGSGSVDPDYMDRVLAEITILFRARLVLDGELAYERLPDEALLRDWAGRVDSRIGLPADRKNKRPHLADTTETKAIVSALRKALKAGPDTEALLALHCDCCLLDPSGSSVASYLLNSASMDARMGSLSETWRTGSALAPIVGGSPAFEPDEPRRRLEDVEDAVAAPRPF